MIDFLVPIFRLAQWSTSRFKATSRRVCLQDFHALQRRSDQTRQKGYVSHDFEWICYWKLGHFLWPLWPCVNAAHCVVNGFVLPTKPWPNSELHWYITVNRDSNGRIGTHGSNQETPAQRPDSPRFVNYYPGLSHTIPGDGAQLSLLINGRISF